MSVTLTSYGVTSQPIGDISELNGLVYAGDFAGRLYRANIATATLTHVATMAGSVPISGMLPLNGILYCLDQVTGLYAWNGSSATISLLQSINFITDLVVHGGLLYACAFSPNRLLVWNGVSFSTLRALSFTPMRLASFGGALYAVSTLGGLWLVTASSETQVAANVSTSGGGGFDPTEFNGSLYICNDDSTNNGAPRLYRWNGSNAWVAAANQHDSTCRQMRSMATWRGKLWGTAANTGHFLSWGGEAAWTQEANNVTTIGSDTVRAAGGALWLGNGNGSNSVQQVDRGPVSSRIFPSSTGKPSHARIYRGYRTPEQARNFHETMKEKSA